MMLTTGNRWSMGETCRTSQTQESSFRRWSCQRNIQREDGKTLWTAHSCQWEDYISGLLRKKLISMSKKTVILLRSLRYSPYLCIFFVLFCSFTYHALIFLFFSKDQLSRLEVYELENAATLESSVAQLKNLGQTIITSKYETQYSSYNHPHEEINARAKVMKWILLFITSLLLRYKHLPNNEI